MYVKGLRYTFILTSCMLFLLFDTFYAHRTTFLFFYRDRLFLSVEWSRP